MEPNLLIVASVALAGGVIIGFLVGNLKSKSAGTRARDAEAELAAYRKQVTEHFGQTAEHFQALGQQYKSLYEHLAAGADSLCDTPDAGRELAFVPSGMLAQPAGDAADEDEIAAAKSADQSGEQPEETQVGADEADAPKVTAATDDNGQGRPIYH
ncbi:MAG: DUF1043 family protein [Gammaproteobacteria bacterium]|jgi:uncharacterized membrane-anchored protein YhcB (DUF1043 family)|nr:DUF1043 family protein [Gammaproteobacteria bacterium]